MQIHQIQVRYEPLADRLLLLIRTRSAQLFAVWLTRRMTLRLHPALVQTVSALAVSRTVPGSVAVPEAHDMLAASARQKALSEADFKTAFDTSGTELALGPEPMLPDQMDLMRSESGGLTLRVRDRGGRSVDLQLGDDFAMAFVQLIESAVAQADWALSPPATSGATVSQVNAPRMLN